MAGWSPCCIGDCNSYDRRVLKAGDVASQKVAQWIRTLGNVDVADEVAGAPATGDNHSHCVETTSVWSVQCVNDDEVCINT